MSTKDLRYFHKNNQKKTGSLFASGEIVMDNTVDSMLFTLPQDSLVRKVTAIVLSAGGASSSVVIKCGSSTVGEISTAATGVVDDEANFYSTLGGLITLTSGTTAPVDLKVRILVEYQELSLTDGTYTD